jgi:iron complex transport system permease protein
VTHAASSGADAANPSDARRRLSLGLLAGTALLLGAGVAAGADGWSWRSLAALFDPADAEQSLLLDIRLPRSLGALCAGALLGLAGSVAQGLFRNPLADPYLVGSASGASLGVVLALALATPTYAGVTAVDAAAAAGFAARLGLAGAAFAGALLGVGLTVVLARGAEQTSRLLLAGVVVGVVLTAGSDLVTLRVPEALRGRQAFLLGSTGYLGWEETALLAVAFVATLPPALALARGLDALGLGPDTAASLGVRVPAVRAGLVVVLAVATGAAVSQTGLVAFVGLAAPHLVRRFAPSTHAFALPASAAAGGVLLLAADVGSRLAIAPEELPVGVLTALFGGGYLLWLLRRRSAVAQR